MAGSASTSAGFDGGLSPTGFGFDLPRSRVRVRVRVRASTYPGGAAPLRHTYGAKQELVTLALMNYPDLHIMPLP